MKKRQEGRNSVPEDDAVINRAIKKMAVKTGIVSLAIVILVLLAVLRVSHLISSLYTGDEWSVQL